MELRHNRMKTVMSIVVDLASNPCSKNRLSLIGIPLRQMKPGRRGFGVLGSGWPEVDGGG